MLTIKYFSTSTCGPCKTFRPIVDKISMEMGISISKIDAQVSTDLVNRYSITGVPTLIFEHDDIVVYRHTGLMSYEQLKGLVNRFYN